MLLAQLCLSVKGVSSAHHSQTKPCKLGASRRPPSHTALFPIMQHPNMCNKPRSQAPLGPITRHLATAHCWLFYPRVCSGAIWATEGTDTIPGELVGPSGSPEHYQHAHTHHITHDQLSTYMLREGRGSNGASQKRRPREQPPATYIRASNSCNTHVHTVT